MKHISVMENEVLDLLNIKSEGIFVDCTLGGGGHTLEILKQSSPKGMVIAIDQDTDAIKRSRKKLVKYKNRVRFVHANFRDIARILDEMKVVDGVDGILMDLGVSSFHLDEAERGFSFSKEAPLDMRMDKTQDLTAEEVVNTYSASELERIFRVYGEERYARKIARAIEKDRKVEPFTSTVQLASLIERLVPKMRMRNPNVKPIHRATRVFQAIRIEVNDELESLKEGLRSSVEALKPGGRLVIISFHSLEDRIVKTMTRVMEKGCICPKEFPQCMCDLKPVVKAITRKPLVATGTEITDNPRARSAKLRAFEKL